MTQAPVIVGAGPAGSAAAIALCRQGIAPTLIDRSAVAGDAICGGFLSWRTAQTLQSLGIDPLALGAKEVRQLRLFTSRRTVTTNLPDTAYGLSRHALDQAMRNRAVAAGAKLIVDTVQGFEPGRVLGDNRSYAAETIFHASGKHDVRGASRPRDPEHTAIGIRVRTPPNSAATEAIGDAIELHLFEGGYAGIVVQEDGSANVCLAVRKNLLSRSGGRPLELLHRLAEENPHFATRIVSLPAHVPVDTIGSVPYGFIASDTQPGVFRLGDQAAVIPSLAGEGMSIAVHSGLAAADAWSKHGRGGAEAYQRAFAARVERPVSIARLAWRMGEDEMLSEWMTRAAGWAPWLAGAVMRATRLAA